VFPDIFLYFTKTLYTTHSFMVILWEKHRKTLYFIVRTFRQLVATLFLQIQQKLLIKKL